MRKRIGIIIICIFISILSVCICGCGKKDTYEETGVELGIVEEGYVNTKPESLMAVPAMWYNFCIVMKMWAPVIIVGSVLVGMLVYDVFKKNREIQQWAVSVLIIKIPLFVFIGVYVFAFIYGVMNEF